MQYIIVLLISLLTLPTAWADNHEPKTKKVCVKQTDPKTKKEKEVCKTIKVHKKLEGTKVEDVKKEEAKKKK
jgi:hypothetical protein